MNTGWAAAAGRRVAQPAVVGALATLAIASVLYSRFDLYAKMIRDSSIYIYAGQRFVHGVPPYASIMDPKGPVSGILCGFGVAIAKLFGTNDVLTVRAEFCAFAIIGVLGIYLLVVELWHSVIAGVVAAAVFAAFKNFAYNALTATDGHLPGIVFVIFAMWLTVRRNWFWAGVIAGLAFLTWQPLFPYPLVTAVCALAWAPESRLRTLGRHVAGMATPLVVLIVYYAASGHLKDLFRGLFIFPLTGLQRSPTTVGYRLRAFVKAITNLYGHGMYGIGTVLFWAGLVFLFAVAAWQVATARSARREALLSPVVLLLVGSFVPSAAYVLYDYIGYPHTWVLLPYAAVGVGAVTAALVHRLPAVRVRWATALLACAVTALAVTCAVVYSRPQPDDGELPAQQAGACALQESLAPGTPLWTIDNPVPFVLLHRRQPDNFPYVGSGLDVWKVQHTRGGFRGWMHEIKASRASIVIVESWVVGKYKQPILHWLPTHGYTRGFIGLLRVFVTPGARAQMALNGIALAQHRRLWPRKADGSSFTDTHCTTVNAG